MQNYHQDDPFEREPLDSATHGQGYPSSSHTQSDQYYTYPEQPYYDAAPQSQYRSAPYSQHDRYQNQGYGDARSNSSSRQPHPAYDQDRRPPPPPPPPHAQTSHRTQAGPSRSRGNEMGESASGGMAGIAYSVADRNARESGLEAMRHTGPLPAPPSRAQYQPVAQNAASYSPSLRPQGYDYPQGAGRSAASSSPSRSSHNLHNEYVDDPYGGYSSAWTGSDRNLGVLDPNDIEDDGDDGLHYSKNGQRNSMLSHNSDRAARSGIGAAAAVGGATAAGGALSGFLGRNDNRGQGLTEYYGPKGSDGPEKASAWSAKKQGKSKRWKCAVIGLILFLIAGGVVGGIVGGVVLNNKHSSGGSSSDSVDNGQELDINSSDIKKLLNNPSLHKVFPGIDYTPINTQYPACLTDPPSQNNVTMDVAVLSQLTNKIRLYGNDCNQTQMVLEAIDRLQMSSTIKVWLGVWQENNATTNKRQLNQLDDILDKYGADPFEGIIVGNEVLFRQDMTVTQLSDVLDSVRNTLSSKNLDLRVATSDLGDDWTSALAQASDYIMANIHPFFAGVTAEEAAAWTWNFWETTDKPFFKAQSSMNIISETGWPTAGGKDCGGASTCTQGSVAGIDELNQYMADWVCQSLANGTEYFWFEAFDEPWKVIYNTPGKDWETEWGLMDVNRNLKDGVKIPDCGGKTVS